MRWCGVDGVRSILNRDNLAFSACWHRETAMAASGFQHLTLDERRSLFRMAGLSRLVAPTSAAFTARAG